MNNFWPFLWFLLVFCDFNTSESLEVSTEIAHKLGEKIGIMNVKGLWRD